MSYLRYLARRSLIVFDIVVGVAIEVVVLGEIAGAWDLL